MTHVITDKCNGCKFTDCVVVCPVDCFYELPTQLVINPSECIDCELCVPECPVEAIYSEDGLPPEYESATEFNATEAEKLSSAGQDPIVESQEPLPSADERREALGY